MGEGQVFECRGKVETLFLGFLFLGIKNFKLTCDRIFMNIGESLKGEETGSVDLW